MEVECSQILYPRYQEWLLEFMFLSETSQGGPSLLHFSQQCSLLNSPQNSQCSSAHSSLAFLAHRVQTLPHSSWESFPKAQNHVGLPQQEYQFFWTCYFSHCWILDKKQFKGMRGLFCRPVFGGSRWLWRRQECEVAGRLYHSHEASRWCAGVQLYVVLEPGPWDAAVPIQGRSSRLS